ncbi:SMI1/KNR4 family protein [Deinococcus sonorensis]|uniref:SMI1/KNR4 family protein n=2 Tax=Deinococcus sonorensis TaxID=309891 RepID=A0AAU7UA01_9DEIO
MTEQTSDTQRQAGEPDLQAAWARIEAWYARQAGAPPLPDGASEAAIARLERHLRLRLPDPFRRSLARHDGVPEGHWPHGELLSVHRIREEWDIWDGLQKDGGFADMEATLHPDARLQPRWWDAGWVPVDADGGGNSTCLDLNPGPKGQLGQLIKIDHERGPGGPKYPDFVAYLHAAAELLEAGKQNLSG